MLTYNKNAIELIKRNIDKIENFWHSLCLNPNAIEIIEKNISRIDWFNISQNPSIFTYDYDLIKKNFKDLGEEIIIKALHPKRMLRLMNDYGEDEIYKCFFDEEL